jgi:hypothetical protein
MTTDQKLLLANISSNPKTWAEFFLKVPRTGEPLKANYVQRKIYASKARKKIILVSRRVGKTFSAIIYILWKCFTTPKTEVLIIGPGESQLIKIFSDLDDFLYENPLLGADVTGRRAKPQHTRSFRNGSTIRGFIAQNGSKSLRGQSADLIYVDEADFIPSEEWQVIDPIVRGDSFRKPPELLATSTPNADPNSRFLKMVHGGLEDDEFSNEYMEDTDSIFVPLDQNPDYTPEQVLAIRKEYEPDRIEQYKREYLCQPVSVNDLNVFNSENIQDAAVLNPYEENTKWGYVSDIRNIPRRVPGEIRTMGVDWDRVQAGPSILIVSYIPGLSHYRVLYREEVNKNTPHLFNYTCDRIIDLHNIVNLDWLYLEATSDTMQVETLQMLSKKRAPELYNRIRGISFNSNYESVDLRTREVIPKNVKIAMVGHLQNLFSASKVKFPKQDKDFVSQLTQYKVVGFTIRGPRYSRTNEHFIDALALACWAIFINYDNPLAKHMNDNSIVQIPTPVSLRLMDKPESRSMTDVKYSRRSSSVRSIPSFRESF